ncbi:MAG: hypothetical protein WKF71_09915 [Pyrinomonadaceae bacterium]
MNDLVKKIVSEIAYHFENSTFQLYESSYNKYVISGDYLTKAANIHKNQKILVNTLNWFDDFWIYFEISFSEIPLESSLKKDERAGYELKLQESNVKIEDTYYNINVTLSVFQGDDNDDNKTQLFRAEWDNYDDNLHHPQPHWQINPFKYDSKTYGDFEEFLGWKEEETFETSLASGAKKNELIKINKFHFAMSGQWAENRSHIHKINNESILLNWLNGMLGHIKEQLKFVKA